MAIKRGSSVDRVGLTPQSNVAASDPATGMVPIALPDAPLPVNPNDGGIRAAQAGAGRANADGAGGGNFKANTGCDNP